MGILGRLFGGRVRAQIENCRSGVNQTLGVFLFERYAKQHDDNEAIALAAAVTNELFGLPPGNEAGRIFLATHRPLVETALQDIKNEPQICYIVSVFTHTLGNVAGNTATFSGAMLQSAVKLRDLGILLPIEQIRMPTTPEDLMLQAREFEQWVVQSSRKEDLPKPRQPQSKQIRSATEVAEALMEAVRTWPAKNGDSVRDFGAIFYCTPSQIFDEIRYFLGFSTDIGLQVWLKESPKIQNAVRDAFAKELRHFAVKNDCKPILNADWLWEGENADERAHKRGTPLGNLDDRLDFYTSIYNGVLRSGKNECLGERLGGLLAKFCGTPEPAFMTYAAEIHSGWLRGMRNIIDSFEITVRSEPTVSPTEAVEASHGQVAEWDAVLSKCDLLMARAEIADMHRMQNAQAEREGGTCYFKKEYVAAWESFRDKPTVDTARALLTIAPPLVQYFEMCSPR